jgi:N utilization substance protein A
MIVTLGRNTEGIMPRSEQIPGEQHTPGERVQALVTEVRDTPSAVKIILSRKHPELVRKLFEREVPEVAERTIEIKALAREAGQRTKIAVSSIDSKVDAVGACVGVRGSRIKNIVEELGGEKIDIVRWNESSQILISNSLKPAEVAEVSLCFELRRATVVVNEDQLSLAIGKRGQNVRLAARLTGWDVDILTPTEFQNNVQRLDATLKTVDGVTQEMIDKIIALGIIDVRDFEDVGMEPLIEHVGMPDDLADVVVSRCMDEAVLVQAEADAKKAADARAKAAAAAGIPLDLPSARADAADPAVTGESLADDADGDGVPDAVDEKLVGANEATPGLAPEITTHKEASLLNEAADSPEAAALHVSGGTQTAERPASPELADENEDMARLASGQAGATPQK